jgi:nitrite reductase/ring-hydroxylating ferredoxin subunit
MSDGERSATRHRIAATAELSEEGKRVIADVDGQEVAVFNYGGEYHAVANYCVHQAGPLCEGELTGDMVLGEDGWSWDYTDEEKYVRCPWHGWVFDITTGENTDDSRYRVPTYDVEVEDGTIYVVR